jgi:hypothetical protein
MQNHYSRSSGRSRDSQGLANASGFAQIAVTPDTFNPDPNNSGREVPVAQAATPFVTLTFSPTNTATPNVFNSPIQTVIPKATPFPEATAVITPDPKPINPPDGISPTATAIIAIGILVAVSAVLVGVIRSILPTTKPYRFPLTTAPAQRNLTYEVLDAPYADPDRTLAAHTALSEFLRGRHVGAKFSPLTGLVRHLRGELFPSQRARSPGDMTRLTNEFLTQHAIVLTGINANTWRLDPTPADARGRAVVGSVARVRQTDSNGIPVYAGQAAFGFNADGQLGIVDSTWFPLPADYKATFKLSLPEAVAIAEKHIRDPRSGAFPSDPTQSRERNLTQYAAYATGRPSQKTASIKSNSESDAANGRNNQKVGRDAYQNADIADIQIRIGDAIAGGKVIFPLKRNAQSLPDQKIATPPTEPTPAQDWFRPAWHLLVSINVHQITEGCWEMILDDATAMLLVKPLVSLVDDGPIQGDVYANNKDAKNDFKSTQMLAEGTSANIADAPGFKFEIVLPRDSAPDATLAFRQTNAYFHLSQACKAFSAINAAAFSQPSAQLINMPGSADADNPAAERMTVKLLNEGETRASYNGGYKKIALNSGNGSKLDPSLDCEVLYHEYAHAVTHTLQENLFVSSISERGQFTESFKEGLAFYFGCTISERTFVADRPMDPATTHQWGEYAYPESLPDPPIDGFRLLQRQDLQKPGYDFLTVYRTFPVYGSDVAELSVSDKETYACGMMLARTLWDVRRALGYELADAVILRSLPLLRGVQTDFEIPAEAIIHADEQLAVINNGPGHEAALRLIFGGRGIMADTPVHGLVRLKVGQKFCVLAATENSVKDLNQSGCLIYCPDESPAWRSVGKMAGVPSTGPCQIVALAATTAITPANTQEAWVWAVVEQWQTDSATQKVTLMRYRLREVNNALEIQQDWEIVKSLEDDLNALALSVLSKPNQTGDDDYVQLIASGDRLIAIDGETEIELFSANSAKRIRDMTAVDGAEGAPPHIYVATSSLIEVYTYDFSSRTVTAVNPTANKSLAMEAFSDDQVYVTNLDGEVQQQRFNAAQINWERIGKPISSANVGRPVFCVFRTSDGAHYAGTNNGVYRLAPGADSQTDWQEMNETTSSAENIRGATVVGLCQLNDSPDSPLIAATAQRGLWQRKDDRWQQIQAGISRIGFWADVILPDSSATASPIATLRAMLTRQTVGTHVLYSPMSQAKRLKFRRLSADNLSDLKITLYFVAPSPDIETKQWSGLQDEALNFSSDTPDFEMQHPVKAGFYLVAIVPLLPRAPLPPTGATLSYELEVSVE